MYRQIMCKRICHTRVYNFQVQNFLCTILKRFFLLKTLFLQLYNNRKYPNYPLSCIICYTRIPRTNNMQRHVRTNTCQRLRVRRENEKKLEAQAKADQVRFLVNGVELERVNKFKYLGRILRDDDRDTDCIEENLSKARKRWGSIAKILKREGANAECMGRFYLTIVQAVLLYGSDSWTIREADMKKLRAFHLRAIRHMAGDHIRKLSDTEWKYPNHDELTKEKCKLLPIEMYIKRRRGTLRRYLYENRKDLMEEAEKVKVRNRGGKHILWWEQDFIEKKEFYQMEKNWFQL